MAAAPIIPNSARLRERRFNATGTLSAATSDLALGDARRAVDNSAGGHVHGQCDGKEHEAGRDERLATSGPRLAELGGDVGRDGVAARLEDVEVDVERRSEHESDGDRLAQGPAEAQHDGAYNAAPTGRQHRETDRLPTRRAQRQGGFAIGLRDLAEDFAG